MWLADMASFMRTLNVATIGDKVFVQTIPVETLPAAMVVVPLTGVNVDEELPGYHEGSFQIIVRAKNPSQAYTLAKAFSDGLTLRNTEVTANTYITRLQPRHLPVVYPRSTADQFEASVNFDMNIVLS